MTEYLQMDKSGQAYLPRCWHQGAGASLRVAAIFGFTTMTSHDLSLYLVLTWRQWHGRGEWNIDDKNMRLWLAAQLFFEE